MKLLKIKTVYFSLRFVNSLHTGDVIVYGSVEIEAIGDAERVVEE